MEPIAAFPGLTSVATSEMLSQLTIDQSLEKGGIELLPLAGLRLLFGTGLRQKMIIQENNFWAWIT